MKERICFYTPPFPRVKSYFDMVDISREYGLKNIEGFNILDFEVPDIEMPKKIREYADSKGIGFSCFSVYINLVEEDSTEMLEKLKKYADVAYILGSPYLHHTIANRFTEPEKVLPYKDEMFQKGILAVREIYDYCEKLGIKAIYEEQGYIFNGICGFKKFLEEVDREVGVVADFANIYQAGDSMEEFITVFSHRIVHAHIKDITLQAANDGTGLDTLDGKYMYEAPVGDGIVSIADGIAILEKCGYKGSYGIEYSAKDDDSKDINTAIELIENAMNK